MSYLMNNLLGCSVKNINLFSFKSGIKKIGNKDWFDKLIHLHNNSLAKLLF